jgi:hypothetical protein
MRLSVPVSVVAFATAGAICLGGCSSSPAKAASSSSSTSTVPVTTTPTTIAPTTTTASTAPPPPPSTTTTVAPTTTTTARPTTTTTEMTCAERAKDVYVHALSSTETSSGGLEVSGNPTTLVCGGPDDYHFNVASTKEVLIVDPGAAIEVLPLQENMHLETIPHSHFESYLKTDADTRIFLVVGPANGVFELQEQFHP